MSSYPQTRRTVMDKEQILALAEKCGIFPRLTPDGTDEVWSTKRDVESFFDAAIESYKAELLKEVGEPVGYLHQWIEYHPYGDTVAGEPCSAINNEGKPFDKSDTVTLLFTSDQVAAAILKATKPLEDQLAAAQEEIEQLRAALDAKSVLHLDAEKSDLRDQLTAAQKEMNVWRNQAHQSQSAFDRLQDQLAKAEQRVAEWQPIETAPKDGTVIMVAEETEPGVWEYEQGFYSNTWGFGGGGCTNNPTHWMPLPKAPNGASS